MTDMGQHSDFTTQWLAEHAPQFTDMADRIWGEAEVAWHEHTSSGIQAEYLEQQGFTVSRGIAGIATAFMAEWGSGAPVIGFVGEYDALPGLSQKAVPYKDPVGEGAAGHGCGHNLLGTGCLAAAESVRWWLAKQGISGTVRRLILMLGLEAICSGYYNPQDSGKSFVARTTCGLAA